MSRSRLALGVLLATLPLTSCNEVPEYRIALQNINATDDTLYVNATLLTPKQQSGGSTELMFDLKPYRNTEFTFGLTLDLAATDQTAKSRTGLVEMAFVSNGCITRIITVSLSNPTNNSKALIGLPIALNPAAGTTPAFTEIPIEPPTGASCYQIKRPVVTAVHRDIAGPYGNPTSILRIYGWGLLNGTTATAVLASPLPATGIDCTKFPCTAWNTVSLKVHQNAAASTTELPLDTTPLNDTVGPLLDQFAQGQTGMNRNALSFVSGPQAKKMATALFPFKVTVSTPVNGATATADYSEPVPPPPP